MAYYNYKEVNDMATFSLYENVKIKDTKTAESFVKAIEESEKKADSVPKSRYSSRKATSADRKRLKELWRKNWSK